MMCVRSERGRLGCHSWLELHCCDFNCRGKGSFHRLWCLAASAWHIYCAEMLPKTQVAFVREIRKTCTSVFFPAATCRTRHIRRHTPRVTRHPTAPRARKTKYDDLISTSSRAGQLTKAVNKTMTNLGTS